MKPLPAIRTGLAVKPLPTIPAGSAVFRSALALKAMTPSAETLEAMAASAKALEAMTLSAETLRTIAGSAAAFARRVLTSLNGLARAHEALGWTEEAARTRALINQIVAPVGPGD